MTQPHLPPPNFSDALKGAKKLVLPDTLHREGVTDDEYRPYEGCNATQMAFIADSIATICNISYQWKAFGNYRHLSSLRQLSGTIDRKGSKTEKKDISL